MTKMQELLYRIECAREFFARRDRREMIERVLRLIEASWQAGGDLTLTPAQIVALGVYLNSVSAKAELRLLQAAMDGAPCDGGNVVPFVHEVGRN